MQNNHDSWSQELFLGMKIPEYWEQNGWSISCMQKHQMGQDKLRKSAPLRKSYFSILSGRGNETRCITNKGKCYHHHK